MTWFLPAVEKWVRQLAVERQFSEDVVNRTLALVANMSRLATDRGLTMLPEPAIENEPVPLEDSPRESVPALTWIGSGDSAFRLMWVEGPMVVRMIEEHGIRRTTTVNPDENQIIIALEHMGVRRPSL